MLEYQIPDLNCYYIEVIFLSRCCFPLFTCGKVPPITNRQNREARHCAVLEALVRIRHILYLETDLSR